MKYYFILTLFLCSLNVFSFSGTPEGNPPQDFEDLSKNLNNDEMSDLLRLKMLTSYLSMNPEVRLTVEESLNLLMKFQDERVRLIAFHVMFEDHRILVNRENLDILVSGFKNRYRKDYIFDKVYFLPSKSRELF